MLKGIAASAGVAVSKVYKLEHPVVVIEKRTGNPEEELNKLNDALTKSRADIETIQQQAKGKLSDEELAIFDAHLMVLDDPEFLDQVKESINNDKVNAEYAVEQIANNFITIFENMDDEYFRERAADIRDVTYRIKCHIVGVRIPNLSLIKEEVVIVAEDLTPSDTAQLDRKYTKGFATEIGGRTSHSAIMARSLEIPAVVGCNGLMKAVNDGDTIILDALAGEVIINPTEQEINEYLQKAQDYQQYRLTLQEVKDLESISLDGTKVELVGNIGTPKDVQAVIDNGGEGVGLYRTEFLYMDATELPTEEEQFVAYKTVLEAMEGKPVVVRTLDIGGDKELSYLPLPKEMNPFLGYRAIRLCLDQPNIFRTQLRALIRASVYGRLCIMFPMVATLDEFREAKALFLEEVENLKKEGQPVSDKIELGMMVEIPSSAVLADQFAKEVDFFSIGTNDLIQYTMAADRMSEKVSYLYQPLNPAILRLIKMTIDGAHKEGKWVGMCGEMAGDLTAVPLLLGLGLDEFSMSASSILEARKLIRSLNKAEMAKLAAEATNCQTASQVDELVKKALQK